MATQAQRQEDILREANQILEELHHLSCDDPRYLDLTRQLHAKLEEYQAVPSDEELRAQRNARYDAISALMKDPALSPEVFLALADEQMQLLQEINAEMNAEQEALLREIHAFQVQRSFRYRFHSDCYRFRVLIWCTFFLALFFVPMFLFLSTDYPWIGLPGIIMAALSLAWAIWSSRPPQADSKP